MALRFQLSVVGNTFRAASHFGSQLTFRGTNQIKEIAPKERKMRHTLLLKSGFGLLLLAGALSPLAVQAFEGDGYDQLKAFQSEQAWAGAERGAQGPMRTEMMDTSTSPKLLFGEGDLYDNLKISHNEQKAESARYGAEGPIRTEGMESPRHYTESDMYDNLKIEYTQ